MADIKHEQFAQALRQRVDRGRKTAEQLGVREHLIQQAEANGRRLPERPYAYRQPIPDDLWIKCPDCGGIMYRDEFLSNASVCTHCQHHFRIGAPERLARIVDDGSFEPIDEDLETLDPLAFEGYLNKIERLRQRTGLKEAILTGRAFIEGMPCYIAAMDSRFLMGSMGSVVGERVTRLFERATDEALPVIMFTVSGGARMQEGILSLMQMAKTSAARGRHKAAGLLSIMVLTDPTTGGVTASFASLGDYLIAEPGALIGFAGRRVIEGTIAQQLPEDFQRAEFLLEHGFLDLIVERQKLRPVLARLLADHEPGGSRALPEPGLYQTAIERAEANQQEGRGAVAEEKESSAGTKSVPAATDEEMAVTPKIATGAECLGQIRAKGRPTVDDWIPLIFDEPLYLAGDRAFADDPALWGGLAHLDGRPVTVIATRKGHDLASNQARNFAMPHPEGYRKALRLMTEAARVNRPILTLIDTPGAYCGLGAEERGQGEAIARNLLAMFDLPVPILSIVTGEGGSGGALAIAIADRLAMLSYACYSVISPRGFASLLWKDPTRELEAANQAKMTASALQNWGICDQIIAEPEEGAAADPALVARRMKRFFLDNLDELSKMRPAQLLEKRYQRFRQFGVYQELELEP